MKRLEDPRPLIRELEVLLDHCNDLISRHNDMVAALTENRRRCTEQVWQLFRWRLDGEFGTLRQVRAETTAQLEKLQKEADELDRLQPVLRKEISALTAASSGVHAAIAGINRILRDTGFEGFEITRCDNTPDAYKVVRKDQNHSTAIRLSEGEKHFLSFLYFYHMVRSCAPDGSIPDRVVVIDDPVSSMDSGALFHHQLPCS